jgi:hypothetical protein
MLKGKRQRVRTEVPDLRTQWESLLDQVWRSEAEWRLWDRVDAAIQMDARREQRNQQQEPRL